MKMRWKSCIGNGEIEWVVVKSEDILAGGCQRRWHSVGGLEIHRISQGAAERTAPRVRTGKEVKIQVREVHLKCAHLEQEQHCTNLPLQITLPNHTKQDKNGPGFGLMLLPIRSRKR